MYRILMVLGLMAMLLSPPMWPSPESTQAKSAAERRAEVDRASAVGEPATLLIPYESDYQTDANMIVKSVFVYSDEKPSFEYATAAIKEEADVLTAGVIRNSQ
jgi:hypothetical protein